MSVRVTETGDLAACLALRFAVFVDEQNVPEEIERDALDDVAIHLLAMDGDRPVGTARIVAADGVAKIGRVCVLAGDRGRGIGVRLIEAAHDAARARGLARAKLGAQVTALQFYERLGYAAYGDVFVDGGMDHRMMARDL